MEITGTLVDRLLIGLLIAIHAVADPVVTGAAVLIHENPSFEKNPLMARALTWALKEAAGGWSASDPVAFAAVASLPLILKAVVALGVAAVAWRVRSAPGWRVWVATVSLIGGYVVVANSQALF